MLHFHFVWDEKIARGDSATWGLLTLNVEKQPVWDRIRWSWVDLLSFLATNWNKLENEGLLSDKASESEKYDFNISHDLAYCARGGSPLPSIVLARKGLNMQVSTGNSVHVAETSVVMGNLRSIGHSIARRLLSSKNDPKIADLLKKWSALTGFIATEQKVLPKLEGPRPVRKFKTFEGPRRKTR